MNYEGFYFEITAIVVQTWIWTSTQNILQLHQIILYVF